MNVFINSIGGILSQCICFQVIRLYALNTLQYSQLKLNKAEKREKKKSQEGYDF